MSTILVNKLSKNSSYINDLALVTKLENKIIGYISFTKVKLNNLDVLALALLGIYLNAKIMLLEHY